MKGAAKLVLLIFAILALEATVLGAVAAGLIFHEAFRGSHHRHHYSQLAFTGSPSIRFRPRFTCHIDARQMDAALKDLADAPDSTIVETNEGSRHVLIRKVGSNFQIDVTDPGRQVHVSVPASFIRVLSSAS